MRIEKILADTSEFFANSVALIGFLGHFYFQNILNFLTLPLHYPCFPEGFGYILYPSYRNANHAHLYQGFFHRAFSPVVRSYIVALHSSSTSSMAFNGSFTVVLQLTKITFQLILVDHYYSPRLSFSPPAYCPSIVSLPRWFRYSFPNQMPRLCPFAQGAKDSVRYRSPKKYENWTLPVYFLLSPASAYSTNLCQFGILCDVSFTLKGLHRLNGSSIISTIHRPRIITWSVRSY